METDWPPDRTTCLLIFKRMNIRRQLYRNRKAKRGAVIAFVSHAFCTAIFCGLTRWDYLRHDYRFVGHWAGGFTMLFNVIAGILFFASSVLWWRCIIKRSSAIHVLENALDRGGWYLSTTKASYTLHPTMRARLRSKLRLDR